MSDQRTRHGNAYGPAWVFRALTKGPVVDGPPGALEAKRCQCEPPWLERDEDDTLHCVRCGRDYTRRGPA